MNWFNSKYLVNYFISKVLISHAQRTVEFLGNLTTKKPLFSTSVDCPLKIALKNTTRNNRIKHFSRTNSITEIQLATGSKFLIHTSRIYGLLTDSRFSDIRRLFFCLEVISENCPPNGQHVDGVGCRFRTCDNIHLLLISEQDEEAAVEGASPLSTVPKLGNCLSIGK